MSGPGWKPLLSLIVPGFLVGVLVAFYARFIEPRRLEVTRLNLATGTDPLTIAFVTDTHIGPNFKPADLEPLIHELEHIQPDVILFGGDFISESPRYLKDVEPAITRITATAKMDSWGIWGNHDIANIRSKIAPVLERSGVTMLTNESVQVRNDLWVAGVDDVLLGRSDLEETFRGIPDDARVIALWHEPDVAEKMVPYAPIFMLSGHTHGGQVRLPLLGALATPKLGKRYVAGKYDVGGMMLYVCRGIGMYRPPVRLHCRPELLIITVD